MGGERLAPCYFNVSQIFLSLRTRKLQALSLFALALHSPFSHPPPSSPFPPAHLDRAGHRRHEINKPAVHIETRSKLGPKRLLGVEVERDVARSHEGVEEVLAGVEVLEELGLELKSRPHAHYRNG